MLNDRQSQILKAVVEEYIDLAEPVGSKYLAQKYDFSLGPASIRNELRELEERGYLFQPHTSAGRVPTDQGYQTFVDFLMPKEELSSEEVEILEEIFERTDQDELGFQRLVEVLADLSNNLAISILNIKSPKRLFYRYGLAEFARNLERESKEILFEVIEDIEKIENRFEKWSGLQKESEKETFSEPRVVIGKKNPFFESDNLSTIFSVYRARSRTKTSKPAPEKTDSPSAKRARDREGMIMIVGPKRMDYGRNIALIKTIVDLLVYR